jgi:phosphoribosylaminoimidazole carboxylase PurE protein
MATTTLAGLDALLATVQMPGGVPVACTAIGKPGAVNAAIFAAEIIATSDGELGARLAKYKEELARSVAEKSEKVKREFQI